MSLRYSEDAISNGKIGTASIAGRKKITVEFEQPKPAPEVRITQTPRGPSQNEIRMAQQITAAGLPEPVREYFHIPDRGYRLDFAWPAKKIGIEVQGGVHRIKGRFGADIEKRALGLLVGWRILELDSKSIKSERGIEWVKQLLGKNHAEV